MIELENPHSVSILSALLEAIQSEIAAGLGAVLCGWFAGCPLMPFLPAPCSSSLAFGRKLFPLPASVWT